jgi:hypothetical protein
MSWEHGRQTANFVKRQAIMSKKSCPRSVLGNGPTKYNTISSKGVFGKGKVVRGAIGSVEGVTPHCRDTSQHKNGRLQTCGASRNGSSIRRECAAHQGEQQKGLHDVLTAEFYK